MKRVIVGVLAIAVMVTVASTGVAAVIWDYTNIFSGTATPESSITATISDTGTGGVSLTMSIAGTSTTEFVSKFYFNYAPVGDLLTSSIAFQSGQAAESVEVGENAFKAGGDGKYDLLFSFDTAGSTGDRFTAGENSVYSLSGLSAANFNVLSSPDGGSGPFVSAIHVQGIGEDSTWLSPNGTTPNGTTPVPEPGTMMLLGSGLVGLAAWGRKKFRK